MLAAHKRRGLACGFVQSAGAGIALRREQARQLQAGAGRVDRETGDKHEPKLEAWLARPTTRSLCRSGPSSPDARPLSEPHYLAPDSFISTQLASGRMGFHDVTSGRLSCL